MKAIKLIYNGDGGDRRDWLDSFTIDPKDSINKKLEKINFDKLDERELNELEISNYYVFSNYHKSSTPKDKCEKKGIFGGVGYVYQEERALNFQSKYDSSSITLMYLVDNNDESSISLEWHYPTIFGGSDKYKAVRKQIQTLILPELITKILSIA